MILLIPIALWLCAVNCYLAFYKDSTQSFRRSWLSAGIAVFFFIAVITELLSIVNLINSVAVSSSWTIFNVILFLLCRKLCTKSGLTVRQVNSNWISYGQVFFKNLGGLTTFMLASLSSITLVVAIVATPNNLDSLSYHLSRLGYWIQNGNIEHYATHIERSISFSPFSEYVHLHTFLLLGSEHGFQLLQWSCLIGILAYISLLIEILSGSKQAMRIALCFAATLPIVILESMTTQNDLVVSFFIVATAFYVFDYIKKQHPSTLGLIVLSAALGMMTKGTFAFFALPFGGYLFISMVAKPLLRKPLVALIAGTAVLVLLLNAPFWYRTYQVFESPIGNMSNGNKTKIRNPAYYLSSVSKHIFLHLGFVSPGNSYNIRMENALKGFHYAIGVPIDAPETGMDFKMNKLNFNEDFAHNFFGMWMILFSIPLLFFAKLTTRGKWYTGLAFASFLIFCFFIGYQIYGSRLHIPFFLLASPVVGLVYSAVFSIFVSKIFTVLLWLSALPFALLSVTHPLLSTKWFFEKIFPPINSGLHLNIQIDANNMQNLKQESILFASPEKIMWGDNWSEMERLKNFVNSVGPQKIGLDIKEASYDYAYQFSLRKPGRRFGHVAVKNPSKILEDPTFQPDLIIAENYEGEHFSYNGRSYLIKWRATDKWIYIPQP
jgi:4-amino-4-deoxy-L-arabinose transferase-like glycosyltransferase